MRKRPILHSTLWANLFLFFRSGNIGSDHRKAQRTAFGVQLTPPRRCRIPRRSSSAAIPLRDFPLLRSSIITSGVQMPRNRRIFWAAPNDATRLWRNDHSLDPLRNQFGLVLGDGGQDVDREAIGLRKVSGDKFDAALHQLRSQSDVAGQPVKFRYGQCRAEDAAKPHTSASLNWGRSALVPLSISVNSANSSPETEWKCLSTAACWASRPSPDLPASASTQIVTDEAAPRPVVFVDPRLARERLHDIRTPPLLGLPALRDQRRFGRERRTAVRPAIIRGRFADNAKQFLDWVRIRRPFPMHARFSHLASRPELAHVALAAISLFDRQPRHWPHGLLSAWSILARVLDQVNDGVTQILTCDALEGMHEANSLLRKSGVRWILTLVGRFVQWRHIGRAITFKRIPFRHGRQSISASSPPRPDRELHFGISSSADLPVQPIACRIKNVYRDR